MKFSLLVLLTLSSFNALSQVRDPWTAHPESEEHYGDLGTNIPAEENPERRRAPSNRLADCSMSSDQRTISCPNGIYKKMQSVVDSARNLVPEKPAAGSSPSSSPATARPE